MTDQASLGMGLLVSVLRCQLAHWTSQLSAAARKYFTRKFQVMYWYVGMLVLIFWLDLSSTFDETWYDFYEVTGPMAIVKLRR